MSTIVEDYNEILRLKAIGDDWLGYLKSLAQSRKGQWEKAANEQKLMMAQWLMGICCQVEADLQQKSGRRSILAKYGVGASDWFQLAADQGNAEAQYSLACYYRLGVGCLGKDEEKGLHWLRQAAEHAHPDALYELAIRHLEDNGVEKDEQKAKELLGKAAEKGHVEALFRSAMMEEANPRIPSLDGLSYDDIPDDCPEAASGTSTVRNLSYAELREVIRSSAETKPKPSGMSAVQKLEVAASRGHVGAQFEYGRAYERGQRWQEAVEWYRKAAEKGHLEAQFRLSQCLCKEYEQRCEAAHENGEDTPEASAVQKHEAYRWCLLAASRGLAEAQYALWDAGVRGTPLFETGVELAFPWLCRAIKQGFDEAIEEVLKGSSLEERSLAQIAQLVDSLRRVANRGHAKASYALGVALCWRNNPHRDLVEAEKWFRQAAELNEPRAINLLLEDGGTSALHVSSVNPWFRSITAEDRWDHAGCHASNTPEEIWCLQAAAEKGHAEAQTELASLDEKTRDGLLNQAALSMATDLGSWGRAD